MSKLLILFFTFILGFITHAFFFPNLFSDPFTVNRIVNLASKDTDSKLENATKSQTKVIFNNGNFYPKKVWILKGNHLYIRNDDKAKQMTLISKTKIFNTNRPYGLSEQIDIIPDTTGNIILKEKLSNATLEIVVK